jgi:F-type H+-transporting ATPase subunit gamma
MAKLRVLVQRRKAIRNIRKITRTMELIATARFKKALDRALEADAYTRKIAELAADLARAGGDASHPLLVVRPVRRELLLVLCSNRGLCGGYNAAILREAMVHLRRLAAENLPYDTELSGKRAIAYFRFQQIKAMQTYTQFEDKPSFDDVEPLAVRYIDMYATGQIDKLSVAYTKFLSASRQVAVIETLLPLSAISETPGRGAAPKGPSVEYEFIPNAEDILSDLVPAAFKARLFKCFLDAAVSEQIARRVAMKAATENAADLIKQLSMQYNRARQATITKELLEIIGGAEALK